MGDYFNSSPLTMNRPVDPNLIFGANEPIQSTTDTPEVGTVLDSIQDSIGDASIARDNSAVLVPFVLIGRLDETSFNSQFSQLVREYNRITGASNNGLLRALRQSLHQANNHSEFLRRIYPNSRYISSSASRLVEFVRSYHAMLSMLDQMRNNLAKYSSSPAAVRLASSVDEVIAQLVRTFDARLVNIIRRTRMILVDRGTTRLLGYGSVRTTPIASIGGGSAAVTTGSGSGNLTAVTRTAGRTANYTGISGLALWQMNFQVLKTFGAHYAGVAANSISTGLGYAGTGISMALSSSVTPVVIMFVATPFVGAGIALTDWNEYRFVRIIRYYNDPTSMDYLDLEDQPEFLPFFAEEEVSGPQMFEDTSFEETHYDLCLIIDGAQECFDMCHVSQADFNFTINCYQGDADSVFQMAE